MHKVYKIRYTVVPVLRDHPSVHKKVVSQDRWSLKTGGLSRQVVSQDRWSLKTGGLSRQVVSHQRLAVNDQYIPIRLQY